MNICNLCRAIPLEKEGLPALPEGLWGHRTTWRHIHQFISRFSETKPTKLPYHSSLESLKSSATGCELCALVLGQVEKAVEELKNPNPDNTRRGAIDIPTEPTWNLWLARRRFGDGFYVFTDCKDSEDFCFVAAIGICVDDEGPLRDLYAGRPIEEDPSSSRTMARAKRWMQECDEHPNCVTELPLLPARVIDIGDGTDNSSVKLREVQGERGRYISLSHCWGKTTQFSTTKASLASNKASILYSELPKSFQDAISITRQLGVRYIWIDSICICQDDNEDWERESAKMTEVYMNSYLTIAASAAEDSTVGCYLPRRKPKYVVVKHKTQKGLDGELQMFVLPMRKEALCDLYIHMADNINKPDHPLATRAWAVQERVLPRRTLHFGKHQMYFECNEGFRGENGLQTPWRFDCIHSAASGSFQRMQQDDRDEHLKLWHDLLWNYGKRKLTKASDKLPAISGVARLISERLGDDDYLAGLWRNSLIEDLLWQGLKVHRVAEYRAPSWSWASVDGTPAMGLSCKWKALGEVLGYQVERKGKNAFGEVRSGWIKLRAPLVPLIMDGKIDPEESGAPYSNNPMIRTHNGDPEGFYSRFDFAFSGPRGREEALAEVESLKGVSLYALILAERELDNEKDDDAETYYCLLVRPAKNDESAMQRQGFAVMSAKHLGECSQLYRVDLQPVTTLI